MVRNNPPANERNTQRTSPDAQAFRMVRCVRGRYRVHMTRRYLMCRPTYFAVDYVINPWMAPSAPVDTDRAIAQWTALADTYRRLGHSVELIEPIAGLPDMVFAANGATVIDGTVLGSQFRYPERAEEGPAYLNWFARNGFLTQEAKSVNEGEGDLLLTERFLLAGTGFRTDLDAHSQAQELFGRPVITLNLVDPRFYHLDTALTVLGGPAGVAYLPEAFSAGSREGVRPPFPDAVIATEGGAAGVGVHAVSDGPPAGLPGRVLRPELRPPAPGPRRRRPGPARPAHADQPGVPARPVRAVLPGAGRAVRGRPHAADEHRRRGRGERHQGVPRVGVPGQGGTAGAGHDRGRRGQLPRAHHDDHLVLHRPGRAQRLRPVHARVPDRPLR